MPPSENEFPWLFFHCLPLYFTLSLLTPRPTLLLLPSLLFRAANYTAPLRSLATQFHQPETCCGAHIAPSGRERRYQPQLCSCAPSLFVSPLLTIPASFLPDAPQPAVQSLTD